MTHIVKIKDIIEGMHELGTRYEMDVRLSSSKYTDDEYMDKVEIIEDEYNVEEICIMREGDMRTLNGIRSDHISLLGDIYIDDGDKFNVLYYEEVELINNMNTFNMGYDDVFMIGNYLFILEVGLKFHIEINDVDRIMKNWRVTISSINDNYTYITRDIHTKNSFCIYDLVDDIIENLSVEYENTDETIYINPLQETTSGSYSEAETVRGSWSEGDTYNWDILMEVDEKISIKLYNNIIIHMGLCYNHLGNSYNLKSIYKCINIEYDNNIIIGRILDFLENSEYISVSVNYDNIRIYD